MDDWLPQCLHDLYQTNLSFQATMRESFEAELDIVEALSAAVLEAYEDD